MRSWLRGREPGGDPDDPGGTSDQPTEGDGSPLSRWLAPSAATQIDQIELGDVRDGWTPERAGETPLAAMMALVRAVGVIDPVLLRPLAEGGFEVVTGHRTVAAARAVGYERVPAVVREMDDVHALVALALDGSATGRLTERGAMELVERLRAAGMDDADAVAELLGSLGWLGIEALVAPAAPAPAPPEPEPEPVAVAPEPQPVPAIPEPEPVTAAPEPEPEPEPVAAATPEPEPELQPVAAAPVFEPVPEPVAAVAPAPRRHPPSGGRWVPMPAGMPRLARLSTAFADAPRMLRLLAADRYSGVVELAGPDGRRDVLVFLEGGCVATSVEEEGRPVEGPLRLPGPDRGALVEINVRPHAAPIVVALALAMRSPAFLTGLHASFVRLPGLLEVLRRERADAACVVSTPVGAGVILLAGGVPVAAYARRLGEAPGEVAETTDTTAVAGLLASGEGEVDVHRGSPPPPIDLEAIIAAAAAETG